MSFDQKNPNPKEAFRAFLEKAESDSWIAAYTWFSAESFGQLKSKMKKIKEGFSRTHKKGTDGLWWGLEVEAHFGTVVGVDLELLMERPILEKPDWITTRLGMSRTSTPKQILEEWSLRESSFKAFAPNNEKILLSQFRRTAPNTFSLLSATGERSVQTRASWSSRWVATLAWRSTT